MKTFFLLLTSLLVLQNVSSQTGTTFINQGGGAYTSVPTKVCLTPDERTAIQEQLKNNISQLQSTGVFPISTSENLIEFNWPLRKAPELNYNNYYAITGYVDQDNTSQILDYNCGTTTYDGHQGIDYITWPFPWYMYENDLIEVVAAADGIIIGKDDNQDDDHCSWMGTWNAIYIQHNDGSTAWYGHLKKNSLTNKAIGQTVVAGEYLGFLASSGRSTAPHLHFEIYDNNGNLRDPYAGDCNNLNQESWWTNQIPYNISRINTILTHDAEPLLGCPGENEATNFSNHFMPFQTVYMGSYFQDQSIGDLATYRIRRPNNSVWNTWTHTSPDTYDASYWWWSWILPELGPFGTWTFEVSYQGVTHQHEFNYLEELTTTENIASTESIELYPNPTTGILNIRGLNTENSRIKILDSIGKIVDQPKSEDHQIDLSNLANGLYFIVIETDKLQISKRIIKL